MLESGIRVAERFDRLLEQGPSLLHRLDQTGRVERHPDRAPCAPAPRELELLRYQPPGFRLLAERRERRGCVGAEGRCTGGAEVLAAIGAPAPLEQVLDARGQIPCRDSQTSSRREHRRHH